MSTNEVLATLNNQGELTLKGFYYMKDKLPDDFEECLVIEKDGHLSAGCWSTGVWSTENGKPGSFRQGRGGVIESDGVIAWIPIERATVDIKN